MQRCSDNQTELDQIIQELEADARLNPVNANIAAYPLDAGLVRDLRRLYNPEQLGQDAERLAQVLNEQNLVRPGLDAEMGRLARFAYFEPFARPFAPRFNEMALFKQTQDARSNRSLLDTLKDEVRCAERCYQRLRKRKPNSDQWQQNGWK